MMLFWTQVVHAPDGVSISLILASVGVGRRKLMSSAIGAV